MHRFKLLVPQGLKNFYHLFQALLANVWFAFPSHKIRVIGITGTNGKTTTVQMAAKILERSGKKVAVASTVNFKILQEEWVNRTKYTTESAFAVQGFIRRAVRAGCEYLVLETSSHALDQYRVWGVRYVAAAITNVTREHLDYHKTMQKYREAKKKLFRMVARNGGTIIVNAGMEKPEEFLALAKKKAFLYAISENKLQIAGLFENVSTEFIRAEEVHADISSSTFELRLADRRMNFKLKMPGLFNIENALAAICVGLAEGVSLKTCAEALEEIEGVPGRMEAVPNNKGLHIFIDYAVTPDSLEKLYGMIQKTKQLKSKIIAVFGSCGERDRGKRPLMGKIVSLAADYVLVTNEDPYHEDPWRIIKEVAGGIENKRENVNFWKILDRREAISKALALAKKGDFIVISGKGAEETMAVKDERLPWNDKKVILEELQKL